MYVLAGLYLLGAVLATLGVIVSGLWLTARDGDDGEGLAITGIGVVIGLVTLAVLAVLVWLAVRVRRGHNWARVLATLLLSIGALTELGRTWTDLTAEPVVIPLFSLVGLVLMIAALALLWLPHESRAYFGRAAR